MADFLRDPEAARGSGAGGSGPNKTSVTGQKQLEENCGVFGVVGPANSSRVVFFGLYALNHRGQESAGLASMDRSGIHVHKGMGLVSQVFDEHDIEQLPGNIAIGHTRYSTAGGSKLAGAQPFVLETDLGQLAIAHNGQVAKQAVLRKLVLGRGVGLFSNSDSVSRMPKYALVEEAAKHCWSKNFMEPFREWYAQHADTFYDAPLNIGGEQDLKYYSLYQEYLKIYEENLSKYIESLDVSTTEFYRELSAIRSDPEIKDKKLIHFVDYLVACTDYESFYKVMTRAAKKLRQADERADAKAGGGSGGNDSKGDSGRFDSESKSARSPGREGKDYK